MLIKGNKAGWAVGQPTFVTRCGEGCNGEPQDGQYAWEWWYSFQVSDNITVTPAVFYLSNLYGQLTKLATGLKSSSVNNIGAWPKRYSGSDDYRWIDRVVSKAHAHTYLWG